MNRKTLLTQIHLGEDSTRQFKADELSTKANPDRLDKLRFRDFLRDVYNNDFPDSPPELLRLLQNMNLATGDGYLNLAGILNPILVSYIAKGILPYHGLGSGVKRAIENWPDIEFVNDADASLFTALVKRKGAESSKPSENEIAHSDPIKNHSTLLSGQSTDLSGHLSGHDPMNDLINILRSQPTAEYASLAEALGVSEATVKRQLQRLKREGRIRRVGSKKSGQWEVLP